MVGADQPQSLLLVGGAAGAGKSTVREALLGAVTGVVLLESDVLWRPEYEQDHTGFRRLWLRLAADISRSGYPVALFGAGFAVPHNIEPLVERAAFGAVHYLALTCDEAVLAERIRARRAPRRTDDDHVREHVDFNRWLRAHAERETPPATLVDTTRMGVEETVASVAAWIRALVRGA